MRLFLGKSTPAIRAICVYLVSLGELSLSLFVSRVRAHHAHDALAPNHLAFVTDLLDRCSHLHVSRPLSLPVNNSPARQVVGGELDSDFVAGKDLDIMHTHL